MRERSAAGKRRPGRPGRPDPACVLITGASSGIGAALALHYARPGCHLLLWGRSRQRLDRVAESCRSAGATVAVRSLDLAEPAAALAALAQDDETAPIALAILAAGLGDMRQTGEATERPETVLELGLVNFAVPAAMATQLAGRMAARGGGRIALLGSVAAFHDLPYAPAYAGSKAGLARFAGALRLGVQDLGVGVVLISPGFVDTPMSRRVRCAKPFLLGADQAAASIAVAIDANRAHLLLPWPFAVLRIVSALLPPPLRRMAMRRTRAEQAPRGG